MDTNKIYDIIGIGIGPFNLGLAALTADISGLECLFIDKKEQFDWHPGMLLPNAKMQVPFYADLVTLTNPCSRFTYLAYLKATGRLFTFAINEMYIPYRAEFNAYCQWVVKQLESVQFGYSCIDISYKRDKKWYELIIEDSTGNTQVLHGKHIVIGVGSVPCVPDCCRDIQHPLLFHSSEYLVRKDAALMNKHITIIGSGQSAAEILLDLLPHTNNLQSLNWFTRSGRFFPMDYSRLALEMSTPEYIDYFYSLDPKKKSKMLKEQRYLYQGINSALIDAIYEQLYCKALHPENKLPQLRTGCELQSVTLQDKKMFDVRLMHLPTEKQFRHSTQAIILATGYHYQIPSYVLKLKNWVRWTEEGKYDVKRNYAIDEHSSLFVQNAEIHTHGFNSADIGLGPYRNAVIINTILGYEHFKIEKTGIFQEFGAPEKS